jgi:hypothetical protein
VVWHQNHWDGLAAFSLKTIAMVSPNLATNPMEMVSPGLVSKPVATVSPGLASKPVVEGFPV